MPQVVLIANNSLNMRKCYIVLLNPIHLLLRVLDQQHLHLTSLMQHSSMLLSESLEAFIKVEVIWIHTFVETKMYFQKGSWKIWELKDEALRWQLLFYGFSFSLRIFLKSHNFQQNNSFILKIPYTFVMKSFLIVKFSKNPSNQLGEFLIFKNIPNLFRIKLQFRNKHNFKTYQKSFFELKK